MGGGGQGEKRQEFTSVPLYLLSWRNKEEDWDLESWEMKDSPPPLRRSFQVTGILLLANTDPRVVLGGSPHHSLHVLEGACHQGCRDV